MPGFAWLGPQLGPSAALVLAALLGLSAGAGLRDAAANCRVTVGDATYDLCPLASSGNIRFCKQGNFSDVTACYNIGVLRQASEKCQGIEAPAVETLRTGLGKGCRVLGSLGQRSFTALPDGGVALTYVGGDFCGPAGTGRWTSTVRVPCNRSGPETPQLIAASAIGRCNYTFTVSTKHGCSVAAPSIASQILAMEPLPPTGGTLLQDSEYMMFHPTNTLKWFLFLAAVYLAFGWYYKSQVLGLTRFPDYIPHIGFWQSYPGLVSDGVKLCISQVTGGEASSTSSARGGGAPAAGPWAEKTRPHKDKRNAERDTFAYFIPPEEL